MQIKELKKRLWKQWTWKQRLSYLWEKYNYFSDHAREIREIRKRLKKASALKK